jgi:deaminated glutathione amidase
MRVACVQMNAADDKASNIATADRLVAKAAAMGAEVVVLPEKWNAYGPPDVIREAAEPAEGESFSALRAWAVRHGVTIFGGSITEFRGDRERLSNTCFVFDAHGALVSTYRKIHMFDVDVDGRLYRESDLEEPGDATVVTHAAGWDIGASICFDLRFPELYRILALCGAEAITVSAAFTLFTGRDHWEVLLRARAIENQCYVAAANQWGSHGDGMRSGGRSMIVDPWGVVLAQAPDDDAVIVADLDRARLTTVRETLPSLTNRRPEAYHWPQVPAIAEGVPST